MLKERRDLGSLLIEAIRKVRLQPPNRSQRGQEDVEDLRQEVLAKVLKQPERVINRAEGEVVVYLGKVSRSVEADRRKFHSRSKRNPGRDVFSGAFEREPPGDFTTPSRKAMREEHRLLVLEAIRALPDRERTAVLLRHFENLPLAAAAERMGVTPAEFSSHLLRATETLQAELAALKGD